MRRLLFLLLFASPLAAQESVTLAGLIAAEDARAPDAASLDVLMSGLRSGDAALRARAVRGLGRLERPSLVPVVAEALADADAGVRAAAAWAVAQAVRTAEATDPNVEAARVALESVGGTERDDRVNGAVLESLGRLRTADPEAAARAAAVLLAGGGLGAGPEARLGAVRGIYFLAQRTEARLGIPASTGAWLAQLARSGGGDPATSRRIRVVAIAAMAQARQVDPTTLGVLLGDPDETIRREAMAGVGVLSDPAAAAPLIARGMRDRAGRVRHAALSVAERQGVRQLCTMVTSSLSDGDPHVAVLAIRLTAASCPSASHAVLLDPIVAALPRSDTGWQPAAHALVSLAVIAPGRAAGRLRPFTEHSSGFVRAYAAQTAQVLNDQAALRRLAADPDPNVRTAAVAGLRETAGRAADDVYIAQLDSDDGQLLITAAGALEGTGEGRALPALLAALERVTALRRETSRDARIALLDRIRELGSTESAPRLSYLLTDFDPAVAARSAAVIEEWTGTRPAVAPVPLPPLPLPTVSQLRELENARVRIEMEGGGVIELRLLPFVAPTNAWRFARLARERYFDGLTFHRIVPGFVVQGGSPSANEYAGDGPFTRDELGHPNWRGTVGLSTRGRDTGDAQLYINLVDNVRLDTDYTVFGHVVGGMAVVDALGEGAVIRRVVVAM